MTYDFSQNTRTEKHKPKRSGVEKGAESIVAQDRAGQASQYKAAGSDLSASRGTLANFEGNTVDSPYYKSMLATSTDATTKAYDSAKASSRSRANAAGFGYTQPIAQGSENEINAREAGALAGLPAKAMEAVAPMQLEAAKAGTGIANTEAGMGTALGSEATATEVGAVTPMEMQYQNRRAQWASQLAKVSPLGGAIAGDPSGLANV